MHIAEGILPAGWAAANYAAATPFVLAGAHKITRMAKDRPAVKPLIGLLGAGVFVISALPIPVPIAGTCSHPTGIGIVALLLGPLPAATLTMVALIIQALFMAHGGISTLGANTLNMGVIGAFSGYVAFVLCRRMKLSLAIGAFAAGFVADLATYAGTAGSLSLALHGNISIGTAWLTIAVAFVPTQLPLAIFEGIITAGVFTAIQERRPDILSGINKSFLKASKPFSARTWGLAGAISLLVLLGFSLFKTSSWEGVDVSVVERYAGEFGAAAKEPFLNITGDMLLFIFTLAGVTGGFFMGYIW
ncbi:MAG: energy-coupling factor ABC transporter permease, partial [Dehalococcoidia bacterium]|nr:energy-coupling factor ABC transporter permease [Dehalococcoidia bacterium]